jgi:sigma-B regulation protein RsbU (phosphoserine phosphatase)
MKILLVDDDIVTRKLIRKICEKMGFVVTETEDGESAWEEYKRSPYRVVISDWVMPKMTGVELCHKIRGLSQGDYTFFFLISDKKTDVEDFVMATEGDADDFIYKPIDPFVLSNQLRLAGRVLGLVEGGVKK